MEGGSIGVTYADAVSWRVTDLSVAIPRPDAWQSIDLEGSGWHDQVSGLAAAAIRRARVAGQVDGTQLEAWAATFIGAELRRVLADVEPSAVLASVDVDAEGKALVSVLAVVIADGAVTFDELTDAVLAAFDGMVADGAMATSQHLQRAEIAGRTLFRHGMTFRGEDGTATAARATIFVDLSRSGAIAVLLGAAAGLDADIMVDVWSDMATELNAVASGIPMTSAVEGTDRTASIP